MPIVVPAWREPYRAESGDRWGRREPAHHALGVRTIDAVLDD